MHTRDDPHQVPDGGFFWVGNGGVWGMGGGSREPGLIGICKSAFLEEIEIPGRKKINICDSEGPEGPILEPRLCSDNG